MKVLMFGWEFPPHISGGLGTACYGLTRGLATHNVDVIFVVPKAHGDEDQTNAKIVGANNVPVRKTETKYTEVWKEKVYSTAEARYEGSSSDEVAQEFLRDITYIEIDSILTPYLSPEQFERVIREKELGKTHVRIDRDGHLMWDENAASSVERELVKTETDGDVLGYFKFSGKYGDNLMEEVANYSIIAEQIANKYTFDVIHAHDWLAYPAGIRAKRASGKPLVIHVHATEYDRTGENVNTIVYNIEKTGMEAADLIITVSNLTRKIVIERYGIPAEKVITVYNAVEPQKEEQIEFKKNVNEKIVTFLGRITFQKGPEYFVEAAHKVLQRTDNVRFVMAGSGDLMRKMIRRAATLKIADKFHFTDFLRGADVTRMYSISDVYVMPSVSEPFGIAPLEAMRSNTPVIVSKQSGVAEVLEHAIKVDFWDVDAIADAIYGLVKYDALSKMFTKYGKDEVDNLKWENAAAEVKKVYEKAVGVV